MTEREIIERLKELLSKNSISIKKTVEQQEEVKNRKKRWATYFRNNPEIFIEHRMKFHSFGYQNFSYHLMGSSSKYNEISTRGVGKSLRCIVFAAAHCLLHPGAKVGVAAVTRSQADEDFQTAFKLELVDKYSIFMKWLYDNGLIKTRETEKGYVAEFWNGSIIYFFPAIDSSRGLHLDLLIGEELRLIPRGKWESICVPMLVPRQPIFRFQPQYIEDRSYDEPTKIITITSNRFSTEYFNTMYNQTVVDYFKHPWDRKIAISFDVFLALSHGLRKYEWYFDQKKNMNDVDFRCEILNESVGEVDGAYFSLEQFQKNRVIKNAFRPPTPEEFKNGTIKNRKKKEKEYRFIFLDFAWAGNSATNENDQTVIGCASCYMKNDKLYRDIEYLETYSGSDASLVPLRFKELFWDYQADYAIYDSRSAGELLFNQLSAPQDNPYRTESEWNNHGFTVCDDKDLHMVTETKLQDLKNRTIDPQAIPCLIPVTADARWNSEMYQDMSLRLKNEQISFLIDELEFDSVFGDKKEYMFLSSEEKVKIKLPYIQTMLMITEAVSLTQSWNNGLLKLEEHGRGSLKDKIVATCYFNSIASKLENKLLKESNNEDIDFTNYKFIF